jgi:hypothetical protein
MTSNNNKLPEIDNNKSRLAFHHDIQSEINGINEKIRNLIPLIAADDASNADPILTKIRRLQIVRELMREQLEQLNSIQQQSFHNNKEVVE